MKTADIKRNPVECNWHRDGKTIPCLVCIEPDDYTYVLHNDPTKNGSRPRDMRGYRYSWGLGRKITDFDICEIDPDYYEKRPGLGLNFKSTKKFSL